MGQTRWSVAIPLALVMIGAPARGSTIRDEARMFSPAVVEEAQRRLDRLERSTSIPVVIETVEHLPGVGGMSKDEMHEAINQEARRRDQRIHDEGIYILISKGDHLISQPLIRQRLQGLVPMSKRDEIRKAFTAEFGRRDLDGGLKRGVEAIERTLEGHRAGNVRPGARAGVPAPAGAARGHAGGGSSMFGTFLLIGMGILAVLLVLRVLGGLFSRSSGAGYPGGPGGPRPGMGPGPGYGGGGGYGGPGYGGGYGGGRGGGFFSGLLGGLGGAMAGNWLYDQMSGRHHDTQSASTYPGDTASSLPDQGDDAIIGADDHGGQGGSWDDGGGTDTGGGDWGGGGGGDWGGGGGDWGGGDGGGGGDW